MAEGPTVDGQSEPGVALEKFDETVHAVQTSDSVEYTKNIRDMSAAARTFALQAKDPEMLERATEIRLRAERRCGQILTAMRDRAERDQGMGGIRIGQGYLKLPTLKSMGINKNQSSRWQVRGSMSDEEFEVAVQLAKKAAVKFLNRGVNAEEQRRRRAMREATIAGIQARYPVKFYNVILEDFEWDFEPYSRETGMSRHASNHYPTSIVAHSAEEVHERTKPRFDCAAQECILFMWTTSPMLSVALDVIKLRGFKYVTNFVWLKDKPGTGYWNRNAHEILLLARRGSKIPVPAPSDLWESVIEAPLKRHSEKPDDFREMIEWYFPQLNKIELNCRGKPRKGWDAWGFDPDLGEYVDSEGEVVEDAEGSPPYEEVEVESLGVPEDERPTFGRR
jgi:N6-adenosine-specific RNA methylase IME4